MKARVYVTLKRTVLDPQGQTIQQALANLGYRSVKEVRQGKVFDLELDGLSNQQAREQIEKVARDVLTNPVIEEFRYELGE
jgi:phosphoribosylformylglycinamidine synthase